MIIYLAWFFASVILCMLTLRSGRRTQVVAMSLFMIALGAFVGLGDMLGGYDRYIYGELFDSMADDNRMGITPWTTDAFAFYGTEFGYGTWEALMGYVTANRYIFIFATTMVIYILLIQSLRQYVDNAPFAVVMFMGLWFFFTFTYLRQVMACTVCYFAVKYIIERKFVPFLIVWFIGYSLHNSALIFLPAYFIPIRKFPIKWVIWVMVGAMLLGLTPFPQALFDTYGDVNDQRIGVEDYARDAGFRWAYLIEAVFFLFVILTNYKQIALQKKNIVMLNMALVFCAILLVFVRSENGGRLGWLFMIGVMCTMSNICIDLKNKKMLMNGALMMVVAFLLFFRILSDWGILLSPYKTFLTNGFREGDYIHENYEYNPSYDVDKFYR